jgi:hypothetical protein
MFDGKASLSLPALIIGAIVPDLEVPFVYWWSGTWSQDRMVLHSLIGGLTLGTLITVLVTRFIYPRLTSAILPVNEVRLKRKCSFSFMLVFSGFLGVLSHLLLDVLNHAYNPLFWPFLSLFQTPSPIVLFLGGQDMASLIVSGVLIVIFLGLIAENRNNFWDRLFVG